MLIKGWVSLLTLTARFPETCKCSFNVLSLMELKRISWLMHHCHHAPPPVCVLFSDWLTTPGLLRTKFACCVRLLDVDLWFPCCCKAPPLLVSYRRAVIFLLVCTSDTNMAAVSLNDLSVLSCLFCRCCQLLWLKSWSELSCNDQGDYCLLTNLTCCCKTPPSQSHHSSTSQSESSRRRWQNSSHIPMSINSHVA